MEPTELCWETGNYTDDCEFCDHNFECSGYDRDDD